MAGRVAIRIRSWHLHPEPTKFTRASSQVAVVICPPEVLRKSNIPGVEHVPEVLHRPVANPPVVDVQIAAPRVRDHAFLDRGLRHSAQGFHQLRRFDALLTGRADIFKYARDKVGAHLGAEHSFSLLIVLPARVVGKPRAVCRQPMSRVGELASQDHGRDTINVANQLVPAR